MLRRDFLILGAAATLFPMTGFAGTSDYKPGLVGKELGAGKTVFLDFTATWCSTCAAQGRVIEALKAENPAYEQAVSFIDVDWDTYRNDKLTQSLNIPRRSTLVVLHGKKELGRIVAGTSRKDIKKLMDVALNATSA